MLLSLVVSLFVCGIVSGQSEYTDPILGYKGPKTPSCVDGTLYATSNSRCSYPSDAIQFWVRQNWLKANELIKSVSVYSQPPPGSFPKAIVGQEQCNSVEDYPLIQWVYSPDLGWVPVIQSDQLKQYFRLESCTSSSCLAGGSVCRTFQVRVRIVVWNGNEAVSTTVLLPDACKCVLGNSLPSAPGIPELPTVIPPKSNENDGRIVFPDEDDDDSGSDEIDRDRGQRRRFFRIRYRRIGHRHRSSSRRSRSRSNSRSRERGDVEPRCNPYKNCWCPCRSRKCELNRERIKNCSNDLKPCNPYTDCRCPCPFRNLQCVRFRRINSPCSRRSGSRSRERFGRRFGSGSRSDERHHNRRWWW